MSDSDRCNLNIAGIDNCSNLEESIPRCWSEPAIGNILRKDLEPPLIQQAAFDNIVSIQYIYEYLRNNF